MLKETKTEKTWLFCHIFAIGGISLGGVLAPPGYANGKGSSGPYYDLIGVYVRTLLNRNVLLS